ncbi:hypothetical protein ASF99_03775 [Exiguobacterium sp. Leaf187]|uniref:DUF4352 domain-containing protein n=1 Tax=Exiguobacterium indicum TaxID=296995 RepID=A0AAW3ME63_9BACL|nr:MULTISPECIES: hypothetical protein [Exiguobacterium]AHA31455.1 hypothetical protein U719_09185 [Exiguobacterium sp. MH3]KQS19013.1 hypothetical protein ASF99_03775 [Exiguobacterium sp. Leaf187]KTR27841.1 hypothetical protein RSA11_04020 [Exiguobacterium indicum]NTY09646.1 hypothetical protein [Exiguobacterium sp. JMULE1]
MPQARKAIPLVITSLALIGGGGWYWSSHQEKPINVSSQTKLAGVNETQENRILNIDELMKQGLVKTYPGDPKLKAKTFRAEALLSSPPKELNLKDKPGYRYVTIPLVMHDTSDNFGAYSVYKPNLFVLNDGKGHEYDVVDYVNHNPKAWKNSHQYYSPHRAQIDLVYQVPEEAKTFVLFAASDAFPKTHTIKIEL